jgi:signal peptidase
MMSQILTRYRKISCFLFLSFVIISLSPFILRLPQESAYMLNRKLIPIVWCCYIAVLIFFVPRVHAAGRMAKRESIYTEAVISAVILIASKILLGSILGQIGESPYDLSFKGILGNLFYVLPALTVREAVRGYVLASFCEGRNVKIFIITTLAMAVLSLNFTGLPPANMEELAIFLATEAGPKLSISIALSYLALYGGPIAAILYIWINEIFHWVSPILSSLNWLAEGAVGILVPIACILFVISKYEEESRRSKHMKSHRYGVVGWLATAVFSIGLLWFIVGVFPVVPSVIVTGSMEPLMNPGDLVLLRQMQTEDQLSNLLAGDVIQFQRDDIRITHRIVEVIEDDAGNVLFRTKGDNNSSEDSRLVHPNDIKGTLVKVVPKVGFPSLVLKSSGRRDISEIEF